MNRTAADEYAQRLENKQQAWWKRMLPVQAPYRWNVERQALGVTLDVGCGLGRNLAWLDPGSVGVDHNERAVKVARARGHEALTVAELEGRGSTMRGSFDSLLVAHVLEHMSYEEGHGLLTSYLEYLKPGGKVFLVCPQERGFRSDPTHVAFLDEADLVGMCRRLGLTVEKTFSFPFPRWTGKVFVYNESCVLARATA